MFFKLFLMSLYCVFLQATVDIAEHADTSAVADVKVCVEACEHAKIKFLIAYSGDTYIKQIADIIANDCQWTGQCEATVRSCDTVTTKQQIKDYAADGFPLALFIESDAAKNIIAWRLYDTRRVQLLGGKQYHKRGTVLRGWAHNIADDVWPMISGNPGIFSTKLAYCKNVTHKKNRAPLKHIMVADFDGSNEQSLVTTPTINLAPRWNADLNNPMLFYSESTNKNIRLVVANMEGKRKIASNFDGLNMQTSFSHDGTKMVYSASRGNGNCQIYYYSKLDFRKITNNQGNNFSATMAADGSKFYYCSDYKTGKPYIYCYAFETNVHTPILEHGYCYSLSYSTGRHQLAYCKMVSGCGQLFVYDELTKEHIQLTFDATSKDECSWSPCGNFLLFAVENKGKSRLAMLNLITNDRRYLTPEGVVCTYPTWSPVYHEYPTIRT